MKPRQRFALAVVAAIVSLLGAGCVSLPTSGSAAGDTSQTNSASSQGNGVLLIARRPGDQWSALQIVSGFLAATGAGFATLNGDLKPDLSVAKDYLTGTFQREWHPTGPPQVIDTNLAMNKYQPSPHLVGSQSTSAEVTATSKHLEVLQDDRLQASLQAAPYSFYFTLMQVNYQWRITRISTSPNGRPSDTITLLTNADFLRDYQPRDLYFLAKGAPTTLVPSPVYIPDSAPGLGVQLLVDALRKAPIGTSWLSDAVTTAFPQGTELITQVNSDEAIVYIRGAATRQPSTTIQQMKAQLVSTLTNAPYSASTGIGSVQVYVGPRKLPLLQQGAFASWLPGVATRPLYYQTLENDRPLLEALNSGTMFPAQAAGRSKNRRKAAGESAPLPLPTAFGRGEFTAIAVSGGIPTFAGCRDRNLYVWPLLGESSPLIQPLQGRCTALTWDDAGNLWVAVGTEVYLFVTATTPTGLTPGLHPVTITDPPIPDADSFVSLKVAPDGLRIAMIVRGSDGSSVLVGGISRKDTLIYVAQSQTALSLGPDLADPVGLSWWDADHLLVLDHRQNGISELDVVPLDGGISTPVPTTPSGAQFVSGNGSVIAVGTESQDRHHAEIFVSHDGGLLWQLVDNAGQPAWTPVYPG